MFVQVPAPVQLATQLFVHCVMVQDPAALHDTLHPLPLQLTTRSPGPSELAEQPPPVHVSSRVAGLECFAVHPPPGHEKMQLLSVPSHTNAQPEPIHDFEQTSPGPVHVQPPAQVPCAPSAAASTIDASSLVPESPLGEPLDDEPEDDVAPEELEELDDPPSGRPPSSLEYSDEQLAPASTSIETNNAACRCVILQG